MTLLSTNDHILSFLPTYQQLYSFPESLGVEVDFIHLKEENEWKIDFEELEKNIRENTKMICLNLPNNPTGTTLDHEEMHQLIQICKKHDLYVLVDEIYRGLYQEESISDLYEKVYQLQDFLKFYQPLDFVLVGSKQKIKNLFV